MNRFQTSLILKCHPGLKINERPYEVARPLVYRTDELPDIGIIIVPEGYRTDFASIPRFMWRIMPPGGEYREAAVVHDYLCDVEPKVCNHLQAAAVFSEAMTELRVKPWKRNLMAWAVKHFGPKFNKAGGQIPCFQ